MFGKKTTVAGGAATIVSYDLGAGPLWAAVSVADPDAPGRQRLVQPIEDTATWLTSDAEAAQRLTTELTLAHPRLVEAQPQALLTAVWVPDPVAGVTQAVMVAELLPADGVTLDTVEDTVRTSLDPGHERSRLEASRVVLPAGPALVIDMVTGVTGEAIEFKRCCWVAPEGSSDMFGLTFATTALHLCDDVAAEAAQVARSLTVVLSTDPTP